MRLVFSGAVVATVALLSGCAAVKSGDVGSLMEVGGSAFKAATLNDADISALSDRSCAAIDSKSNIAPAANKYAKRLATVMGDLPSQIKGQTVSSKVYLTNEVNAWAMGNGCIRVYSGLMDLMNDDELRGIIGHEQGHVALGHSKKAMQTAYAVTAARQAAGAAGGATAALSASQMGDFTEKLINAQFSQSQESDSDNYAFDLLNKRNLKLGGLVTAFEKLAKLGGGKSSMFDSHPSSTDRAANMQKKIDAVKKG